MRNASIFGGAHKWVFAGLLLLSIVWGQAVYSLQVSASTTISSEMIVQLTNSERQSHGLSPLKNNSQLSNSSQNKAQHMITNDYWSHDAPDGTTPWFFIRQAGVDYSVAGENLARGFNYSDSMMSAWMNSDSHRANILNTSFDSMGVGIVYGVSGGRETAVVVVHYGAVNGVQVVEQGTLTQANNRLAPAVSEASVNQEQPTVEATITDFQPEPHIQGSWWGQLHKWWTSYIETDGRRVFSMV